MNFVTDITRVGMGADMGGVSRYSMYSLLFISIIFLSHIMTAQSLKNGVLFHG